MAKHKITERIGGDLVDEFVAFGRGDVRFLGGGGNDFLQGSLGDDYVAGQGGNDRVIGAGGSDRVKGGIGNDVISGGRGDDAIWGGSGDDRLLFGPAFGHDEIRDFEQGHDRIDLIEVLREDGTVRIRFSDLKISYDHNSHEAIIRVPGQGKIEVLHFNGTLHESDFFF